MPKFEIAARHPQYQRYALTWKKLRCMSEGTQRVKAPDVDTMFLPQLEGQVTRGQVFRRDVTTQGAIISTYEAYKERASFVNYTARAREGLVGAVMRKAPKLNWIEDKQDLLEHVGYDMSSFEDITNDTLDTVVGIGRMGHLVDAAPAGGDPNPYIATYTGESITNWEYGVVNGRKHVTRVHLLQDVSKAKDGSDIETFLLLRLGTPEPETPEEVKNPSGMLARLGLTDDDLAQPIYYQEVWQQVEGRTVKGQSPKHGSSFVRTEVIVPRKLGGAPWREIPFVCYNSTKLGLRTQKPILDDIAEVNIAHYRNSADLEHGLHFSGLPQPWVAGFKFQSGDLMIGSAAAWVSENPDAKAGYLEVQSDFAALSGEMERKEKRMATIGGRILEEPRSAGDQEAPGTVKQRHAGERSVLARVAMMCSHGLTAVLRFVRDFYGNSEDDVSVYLNRDFGTEELSPSMLTALMQSVLQGLMSWDTFVWNAQRGELFKDGWEQSDEEEAIRRGVPGRSLDELLDPLPADYGATKAKKPQGVANKATQPKKPKAKK